MSNRILLLTAMDPNRDIRANKVAKSLTKFGYEVKIVGGHTFKAKTNKGYTIESFRTQYDTRGSIVKKISWKLRFYIYARKIYRKYNPHIVHCANIDMLIFGYLMGYRNSKLIYDSYEINSQKSGVANNNRVISRVIEFFERFLLNKIESMIVVSHAAKEYFIDKYDFKKISVITNVPNNLVVSSIYEAEKFNVMYIGSFTTDRGIEEFILSGKYLMNYNINLLLQGFGGYENELRLLVEENNLSQNVQFIEPVDPENIINEIKRNAKIGVVLTKPTSLNHKLTVSNKLFDYINAEVPVIMSDVREHNYINEVYNVGEIVRDINPESIAKSIIKMYHDKIKYEKYRTNTIKAAKVLNWENEEIKLEIIYNQIGVQNEA